MWREYIQFACSQNGLDTVGGTELGKDMFDMALGRVGGDDQCVGNCLVGGAIGQEGEDFLLTRRQGVNE